MCGFQYTVNNYLSGQCQRTCDVDIAKRHWKMADDISQEGDEHARFIEDELSQVKQKVPEVPYARLIAAVMDLVKVEIK